MLDTNLEKLGRSQVKVFVRLVRGKNRKAVGQVFSSSGYSALLSTHVTRRILLKLKA
jgi:hypothetical protein